MSIESKDTVIAPTQYITNRLCSLRCVATMMSDISSVVRLPQQVAFCDVFHLFYHLIWNIYTR